MNQGIPESQSNHIPTQFIETSTSEKIPETQTNPIPTQFTKNSTSEKNT
ncbi:hypothetical protein KSS87_016256 [Heliosperma pusillum]|nr:hypothetical protein KSS87_016256 [Heliosperma pusillum]